MGLYSTKAGLNTPGQPVYIEDSTSMMNSNMSFFEYVPGTINSRNNKSGAPMFFSNLNDILSTYADYLTHFGKNDGRDTYIVVSGCQAYISSRDLDPEQTRNPLELSTFFDPVRISRIRSRRRLTFNPLSAPGDKVLSRGSGIFEPDVAPGATRKIMNIRYKTLESSSVQSDPELYAYAIRSLNECFPSNITISP